MNINRTFRLFLIFIVVLCIVYLVMERNAHASEGNAVSSSSNLLSLLRKQPLSPSSSTYQYVKLDAITRESATRSRIVSPATSSTLQRKHIPRRSLFQKVLPSKEMAQPIQLFKPGGMMIRSLPAGYLILNPIWSSP